MRSREIEIRDKKMETDCIAHDEMARKIEEVEAEAADFKTKVEELRNEVEQKEKDLGFLCREISAEKENLGKVQNTIRELEEEMGRKITDLEMVAEKITECKKQLCLKEVLLDSRNKFLEQRSSELESKEKEYNRLKASLKEHEEELKLNEKQFDALKEFEEYTAHFTSSNVQQNPTVSDPKPVGQMPRDEYVIISDDVSASPKHNEVLDFLRSIPEPAKVVLDLLRGAIRGNHWQSEEGLEESVVKNCLLLLEGLLQVRREIKSHLQLEALKLAFEWKMKMTTRDPDHFEALVFLEILVAYNLVHSFSRDEIAKLSWSIAHYKHAPQIFQFLGFSSTVRNIVPTLISLGQYVPAIQFILWFKLADKFNPVTILKKEIENLRRSQNPIKTQTEGRDAAKMRAILEIIADYKLEVDLPGDLIAKFMFQPGYQNISIGSFIPVQEPASTTAMSQMQSQPLDPATPARCPGPAYQISPAILPPTQTSTQGAFNHQAGSGVSRAYSQHRVGDKRPRIDAIIKAKRSVRQPMARVFQTQTQPLDTAAAAHCPGPGYQTSSVAFPCRQTPTPGAFNHQAGSGVSCAYSQQLVGDKLPGIDAIRKGKRSARRPCSNSQSWSHLGSNGGC